MYLYTCKLKVFTRFRVSTMYYVVTLNFRALSCKRSCHRYCKCFRYFSLFVMPAITFTLYLVVCSAQTVLRTWRRTAATSEVRAMYHSSWRPGLPSGAAGTIFALLHFFFFAMLTCFLRYVFLSTGSPVELYSPLPAVAAKNTPVSQLQRWRQWRRRRGRRIPVWASHYPSEYDKTHDQKWTGGLWTGNPLRETRKLQNQYGLFDMIITINEHNKTTVHSSQWDNLNVLSLFQYNYNNSVIIWYHCKVKDGVQPICLYNTDWDMKLNKCPICNSVTAVNTETM